MDIKDIISSTYDDAFWKGYKLAIDFCEKYGVEMVKENLDEREKKKSLAKEIANQIANQIANENKYEEAQDMAQEKARNAEL